MCTGKNLQIYDDSQTEIEQDILQNLLEANPELTLIIKDANEGFLSPDATISCTDKTSEQGNELEATPAKEMVYAALKENPRGEDVLEEYKVSNTLSNEMRRVLVKILVGNMTEKYGRIPTRKQREQYALGIVSLFPSLKDPFSKKGYEHFYDADRGSGYLAWSLKTVQRNASCHARKKIEPNSSQGGPIIKRGTSLEQQLDADAVREAISLLKHTSNEAIVFEKMRETFCYSQELVHNADTSEDILETFPRFLDTKGLVNQDFILLFNTETSSKLLEKWDSSLKTKIIQEARCLTPDVQCLLISSEKTIEKASESIWDNNMSTLLLLIHLLPPTAGPKIATKISASDAADKLVVFQKPCCSIDEHLGQRHSRQPYLLAMGRSKDKIDNYYVVLDKKLIPCFFSGCF